jgi:hypothetical protein
MKNFFIVIIAIAAAGLSGTAVYLAMEQYVGDPMLAQSNQPNTSSDSSTSSSARPSPDNVMGKTATPMIIDPDTAPSSSSSAGTTVLLGAKARYLTFAESVVGNGDAAILFFHSSSSPESIQMESDLKTIYKLGTPTINTYKVDYDIATSLSKKYGVTDSNALVMIDGKGQSIKTLQGASRADLELLLK